MLVDSHCHLDFPQLYDNLTDVLENARCNNVGKLLNICTKRDSINQVIKISEQYPSIYHAIGSHPLYLHEEQPYTIDELISHAHHPRMIGIGETGLDLHYRSDTLDKQINSFRTHIAASRLSNLPVIIHARDADEEIINILQEEHKQQPFYFVLHCFSSGKELAEVAVDCGGYVSMSGIITFKNSQTVRDIFKDIVPLERVLIETDSPYLAPAPMRGKSNEPAWVKYVAKEGANMYNMDFEDFTQITYENFTRLFPKIIDDTMTR